MCSLFRATALCVGAAAGLSVAFASVFADDHQNAASPRSSARASATKAPSQSEALAVLSKARPQDGRLVATDAVGRRFEYSLAAGLQARVARILRDYQVPYAALVALEPATGRVLAYVNHSSADPNAGDIAGDPTPPAASVFKLVTSSALIDSGLKPNSKLCYGGGASRLDMVDLVDDPKRDRNCASLAEALGSSINAVFAKFADRHLDAATLRRYATAFGFGRRLPFPGPVAPSAFEIPSDRLEFARTAAGFWHVHMSPVHAALIAATFANDGSMPQPSLVDRVLLANGSVAFARRAHTPKNVLPAATARSVAQMMVRTVRSGTARAAFCDERGRPLLAGVEVAGKTGSLNGTDPFRAYSWWVGFAPVDKPTIALAALVVNTARWRIKSSFLAREALREYLSTQPAKAVASAGRGRELSSR